VNNNGNNAGAGAGAGAGAKNQAMIDRFNETEQFGASNTAYRPPPPAENVVNSRHSAAPLDKANLNLLAKKFADGIPEEEFSVAALQGCKCFFLFLFLFSIYL
jgi:hypothetical protein